MVTDSKENMVVTLAEALQMAEDKGLDLVEVSPNADPPVCRIMDYGKFKYESQKKEAEARKKQKIIEIKEIKFRPKIDIHDYETKKGHVVRFLKAGDKVCQHARRMRSLVGGQFGQRQAGFHDAIITRRGRRIGILPPW